MAAQEQAKRYIAQGALFVAVGSDTGLLMNSTKNLVDTFSTKTTNTDEGGDSVY